VHFNEEDNSELSRLRRQLAEEKLRAEENDRQLADMQAVQRGLTTRIGHADALIAEQKNKLAEREAELALAGREIRAGRRQIEEQEAEIAALRRQLDAKPRGRPRKEPEQVDAEANVEEPQPVKWWKD
jgi:predicted  nucleic acid-binding Zn-ribbon protein